MLVVMSCHASSRARRDPFDVLGMDIRYLQKHLHCLLAGDFLLI
jgi:hypothetical protein